MSKDIEDLALLFDISNDSSLDSSNRVYEDDSVIENCSKSKDFFEMFGSRKRKKNVVRSRPIRPRSCKKKKDISFPTKMVHKPARLEFDE